MREGVTKLEEKRRKERIRFFEIWQLNEATECGTNGEWLQTQGNYFLAGGIERARAPSLTGCSLLMDRGMATHMQEFASTHTYNYTRTLTSCCFATIKSAIKYSFKINSKSGMLIMCFKHEKYEEYVIFLSH